MSKAQLVENPALGPFTHILSFKGLECHLTNLIRHTPCVISVMLKQSCQLSIITPILQMRRVRFRESNELALVHASKQQGKFVFKPGRQALNVAGHGVNFPGSHLGKVPQISVL